MLAPKLRDVFEIDQVSLNADDVAVPAHASGDHSANVQLLSYLARIDLFSFVTGHDAARHNAQLRQLGKAVDQALGDLVIYILRVRIGRLVYKRQYGNRLNR